MEKVMAVNGNQWVRKCGNALYFLLIFVIMLDPTNTVLHLKDIVFVLLVGFNCLVYKPDFSYLPHILTVYAVVFACFVIGEMQGSHIDEEMLMGTVKGFAPMVLLLWSPYYPVIRLSKVPVLLVSTVIAVLYVVVSSSEVAEIFVWKFVKSHNDMIMMTHRSFLGIPIFGMYYKSIISFIFVLFLYYYQLYNVRRYRIRTLLAVVVLSFAFLVSGTRATMLLPFFMLGLVMYRTFMKWRKAKYFFYPVLALFVVALLLLVVRLATEQGEASNAIKYAHLTSYGHLFSEHPEYLLWGQGPGAIFYSEGFGAWTAQTEWTYIELLRNYGLLSVGILAVLLLPLHRLLQDRENETAFGLAGAYAAYLMIAGTNPLLVSSTGMIVLLAIYSYVDALKRGEGNLLPTEPLK